MHIGQQSLVVSSHQNLANLLINDDWVNYKIQKVSLSIFIEKIIPYLKEAKYILSLNLSPDGQNIQLSPEKNVVRFKIYPI